jgi:hypothetical protein
LVAKNFFNISSTVSVKKEVGNKLKRWWPKTFFLFLLQ